MIPAPRDQTKRGKIEYYMDAQPIKITNPPPQLIASLVAGFNAVANHIWLILFPVAIDLYLWLGPHLNLKAIFEPITSQFNLLQNTNQGPEMAEVLKTAQQFYDILQNRFNLATALRTYPVGVPSLMAGTLPIDTPLGAAQIISVTSLSESVLLWLLLVMIGLAVGAIYFYQVSRVALTDLTPQTPARIAKVVGQVFVLSLAFVFLAIAISIPLLLVMSLLMIISVGLAQLFLLLFSLVIVWILVPLLFAPHGIFVNQQNAMPSMLTSARLVRYILPGIGGFLLAALVLSQGLDSLWRVPPTTSWLTLVGILGHAFISTSLLSASFIYYRDGIRFVQELLQQRNQAVTASS